MLSQCRTIPVPMIGYGRPRWQQRRQDRVPLPVKKRAASSFWFDTVHPIEQSWHDSVMTDDTWDTQGRKAQQGIAPIRFLIGSWKGEGHSQGIPVRGTLEVVAILDGTWIQATETLTDVERDTRTVDVCLYRWHEKAESLQVFQLYEHAHLSTLLVEKTENGFRWITGPLAPQLTFEQTNTGFQYRAVVEGESTPITEMNYVPT